VRGGKKGKTLRFTRIRRKEEEKKGEGKSHVRSVPGEKDAGETIQGRGGREPPSFGQKEGKEKSTSGLLRGGTAFSQSRLKGSPTER